MTDDDTRLYRVNVDYTVSPAELKRFHDLLEADGYRIMTDLSAGNLDIHRPEDSA